MKRVRNSAVVAGLSFVNMAIGVGVQTWVAERLGTGRLADTFQTGVTLPTMLATAILGALPSLLIPNLVGEHGLNALGRRATGSVVALGAVLTVACFALASPMSKAMAPAFPVSQQADLAMFVRVTAPCALIAVFCAIGQSRLHATHRFGIVGAAGLVNGIGLFVSLQFLALFHVGVSELALCVVAGYLAQLLWMVPGYRAKATSHRGIESTAIVWSACLLVLTYVILRVQPVIERSLASSLGAGTTASFGYASKIQQALLTFAAFGVGVVTLPAAAAELRAGRTAEASSTFEKSLELTLVVTIFACCAGIATCRLLVAGLFAHGAFSSSAVSEVSRLVLASLLLVLCSAIASPCVAVLYAASLSRRVIFSGVCGLVLGVCASFALRWAIGGTGILLGSGVGAALSLCIHVRNVSVALPEWSPLDYLIRVRVALAVYTFPLLGFSVLAAITEQREFPDGFAGQPVKILLSLAIVTMFLLVCAAPGALRLVGWAVPRRVRIFADRRSVAR